MRAKSPKFCYFQANVLQEIKIRINDEKFKKTFRLAEGKFERKRKFPFEKLMAFLLSVTGRSLQREIDSFFEALGHNDVSLPLTKGAVSKARSYLDPQAFKSLNQDALSMFYQHPQAQRWKGHIVKAVDGSTTLLPEVHESVKKEFQATSFGPKSTSKRHISRISIMSDVLNGVVCNSEMAPYTTDENCLAREHIKQINEGDLVLFDRQYESYDLMLRILEKGGHFCVRMREGWWKEVRKLMNGKEKERIVKVDLPVKKYGDRASSITLRFLKMKDKTGKTRVFCTSLLDTKKYSRISIANLYKKRWRVEEDFKTVKCALSLVNFSGHTSIAIRQDFYSKTLLLTLNRILLFKVKPQLKKVAKKVAKSNKKVKVNITYTLGRLKKWFLTMWDKSLDILQWIKEFTARASLIFEYTNEGNQYQRKFKREPYNYCNKNL